MEIPQNVTLKAEKALGNLLPVKSNHLYEEYDHFLKWKDENRVNTVNETVFMAYFQELPGGRPEADFTLDLPRSEHLLKRMKEDKKWRCRCRLLTSFLGLVFFLLSVMAVSLILTRGKRMFGSMV